MGLRHKSLVPRTSEGAMSGGSSVSPSLNINRQ